MRKVAAVAIVFVLCGCTTKAMDSTNDVISKSSYLEIPHQDLESELVGIWAMEPLRNGIANVVEFKSDGTGYVHVFQCDFENDEIILGDVEKNRYHVSDGMISVTRDGYNQPYTSLRVNGFRYHLITSNPVEEIKGLSLSQTIEVGDKHYELSFNYLKSQSVVPLCALSDFTSLIGVNYACNGLIDCIFKAVEQVDQ